MLQVREDVFIAKRTHASLAKNAKNVYTRHAAAIITSNDCMKRHNYVIIYRIYAYYTIKTLHLQSKLHTFMSKGFHKQLLYETLFW